MDIKFTLFFFGRLGHQEILIQEGIKALGGDHIGRKHALADFYIGVQKPDFIFLHILEKSSPAFFLRHQDRLKTRFYLRGFPAL